MSRRRATSGLNEELLWDQFRSGNEVSFACLYQEYVQVLYHYCTHFAQDRALIKDCIHDLFAELWRHRQNIGPTTSVRFYLMASIKRKLVRHITADQKISSHDDVQTDLLPGCAPAHEATLIAQEEETHRHGFLHQAMDQLPRRQREAVYLRYFQNMSNEEISTLMQINIQSVYNLIFGALNNLKKTVTPEAVAL